MTRKEQGRPRDLEQQGVLRWLISCDESGMHRSTYYGFGSLWMNWQRRGDFARAIRELRELHGCHDEMKWSKTGSRRFHEFYLDAVTLFFEKRWLSFQCIVIKKADVDRSFHGGDEDLARRKHFTLLLTNKIERALRANRKREQTFRIWVDPIASRYEKADEAVEVISNIVLGGVFGKARPVDSVVTRDSKDTPSIQLCDLLLGAVMEGWHDKASSARKRAVHDHVASYLGWPDLHSDTQKAERKFNIWYFYDPTRGPRKVETRDVVLKHPL